MDGRNFNDIKNGIPHHIFIVFKFIMLKDIFIKNAIHRMFIE
jgi:hypothetical protein